MWKLIKIFFIVLILIFLVPMVWLLLKELFWFFGFSLVGLLSGISLGTEFGWFLLFVVFVLIIIWLLSCDWVICLDIYWFYIFSILWRLRCDNVAAFFYIWNNVNIFTDKEDEKEFNEGYGWRLFNFTEIRILVRLLLSRVLTMCGLYQ